MTTALEQAFPLAANWLAANVRQKLAECGIFVSSTAALSGEDFTIQPWAAIAVRGNNGALEFYAYDSADTTTADDAGVSCIVVSGRRYKKRIYTLVKDAAISATVSAQPASPSLGDTYIVPAAPTGTDWASQAKTVATFTARGWIFRQPFVGMLVYSAAVDGFYTYTSGGVWSQGLPIGALADGSIVQEKLLDAFYTVYVEDQRNAPPGGTPTNNTRYQVGTVPTGAFAGHANAIARWNSTGAGSWVFFTPVEGSTIYRRDIGVHYSYRSGTWVRTVAAPVVVQSYYVDIVTVATSSAAITSRLTSPSITAAVGQKLRVSVSIFAATVNATSSSAADIGIRVDTGGALSLTLLTLAAAAAAPTTYATPIGAAGPLTFIVEMAVPDAAAHTYSIASIRSAGANGQVSNVTCRALFEIITPS
jgi:hypothetical protein